MWKALNCKSLILSSVFSKESRYRSLYIYEAVEHAELRTALEVTTVTTSKPEVGIQTRK